MIDWWAVAKDGWTGFNQNALEILYFFFTAYGLGAFATRLVDKPSDSITAHKFSKNVCIGILVLPMLTFFAFFTKDPARWIKLLGWIFLALALLVVVVQFAEMINKRGKWIHLPDVICCALFLLLVLSRLVFVSTSLFPSYADSAAHYEIVQKLIYPPDGYSGIQSLIENGEGYYHVGFHLLAAWLVLFFNLSIERGIILTGQLMLAATALAIFSLVFEFTRERKAAVLAAVIAEFAFQLPSFAVNWGKYPALAGLVLFPITFAYILKIKLDRKKMYVSLIFLMVLLIGNFLFHSRIIFYALFAFIGWGFVRLMERSSIKVKFLANLIIAIAMLVLLLTDREGLTNYYGGKTLLVILLAILLPFSIHKAPKLGMSALLFLVLMFLGARIHLNLMINGSSTPVIDSTFSAMSLFIPLSILAATGIAGVVDLIPEKFSTVMISLVVFLILVNIDIPNTFYAHPCCDYLRPEDMDAISWIEENTERTQPIIVSGDPAIDYLMGVDAGVWIPVLTERPVQYFSNDYPWDSLEGHEEACKLSAPFVFVGSEPQSFEKAKFTREEWYLNVFNSPADSIYQVVGCN